MLQAALALVCASNTTPSRRQNQSHRHWPCNRLVREVMCDVLAGLTNVNAESLRRDIEVRISAMMPLIQPCKRRVVSLWRYRAEFRRAVRFSPMRVSALSTKGWAVRHSRFRVQALCFRWRPLSFRVPCGDCPWPSSAASRICFRGVQPGQVAGERVHNGHQVFESRTRSGRDGPRGPQSTCRFHRGEAFHRPPAAHVRTPGGRPRSADAATRVQSQRNGPHPHRPCNGWPVWRMVLNLRRHIGVLGARG